MTYVAWRLAAEARGACFEGWSLVRLRTEFQSSLQFLGDGVLDEFSVDSPMFARRGWLRLLDRPELRDWVGGKGTLQFAVVYADHQPACVCPVLRARGAGTYFLYSIEEHFFEHWIEEALRLHPDQHRAYARLRMASGAFKTLLKWTGSVLDDAFIVSSPLSYRGELGIASRFDGERDLILGELARSLERWAVEHRRPVWIQGIEGDEAEWRPILRQRDWTPAFLFHDNRLELEGLRDFEDYLSGFRRTTRRAFQRDQKRTRAAGISFRVLDDMAEHAALFSDQYERTYDKYGRNHFHHPPEFFIALQETLGDDVEAIVAEKEGAIIGFSILLKNPGRKEIWTYRMGRVADAGLEDVPYYFDLSFYAPIARAIELGYSTLWLGPAGYEAKNVRGAEPVPLYSYFFFPRRLDRWLLGPYVEGFGRISRSEIEASFARTGARPPRSRRDDGALGAIEAVTRATKE